MLNLWMCNQGEDFIIKKNKVNVDIMTSDSHVLDINFLKNKTLSVTDKTSDNISVIYQGHRLIFEKETAYKLYGKICGKTKTKPKINTFPVGCTHSCSNCKNCCR